MQNAQIVHKVYLVSFSRFFTVVAMTVFLPSQIRKRSFPHYNRALHPLPLGLSSPRKSVSCPI